MGIQITNKQGKGRPSISDDVWNEAVDMFQSGKSADEVIARLGISQTKAYEIRRHLVKRNPPAPDTSTGASDCDQSTTSVPEAA